MKSSLSIFLFLIVSCFLAAPIKAQSPNDSELQIVPVLSTSEVSVNLQVKPSASIADGDWIAIEFTRKTDDKVVVKNGRYRIESVRDDWANGKNTGSVVLAAGNTYDLFPQALKTTASSEIVLPATYCLTEQISNSCSASLGLGTRTGLRIQATIHLELEIAAEKRSEQITTPEEGVRFSFNWAHPTESQFPLLQAKLNQLLSATNHKPPTSYLLSSLLKIPDLTKNLEIEKLFAAIELRHPQAEFSERRELTNLLREQYKNDPRVVSFVRRKLEASDANVLEIMSGLSIWDDSFHEPFLKYIQSDLIYQQEETLVRVFRFNHQHWAKDRELSKQYSSAILEKYPCLKLSPSNLPPESIREWKQGVELLSYTGDKDAIRFLLPYLDDKRRVCDKEWLSLYALPMWGQPCRLCDIALSAMLELFAEPLVREPIRPLDPFDPASFEQFEKLRDQKIAELKQRLANR